jgi:hypothetical protein
MGTILSNPVVLSIVLGSLGTAVGWLWAQFGKEKARNRTEAAAQSEKHRQCEIELARLTERDKARDKEATGLRTTCDELMKIVAKGGSNA